jgi:nucleoside-diphosphate-sugar epimerase
MNVFVTGGSGFLGSYVVPRLVERGDTVHALARSTEAARRVGSLGAVPQPGDLDDAASVDAAFAASDADTLVNLASLGFGHAETIVAAAEEAGMQRALFVSTTAIFTKLPAPSRAVRVAAEDTVRSSGLDWTILRPTMIYGSPEDRNMWRLLRLLRRSPVVPVPGSGRSLQQPVHVDDLAATIVRTLDRPVSSRRCYDVAGPSAITFREVIEQAGAAVGRRPLILPVPLGPAVALAGIVERVTRSPRLRAEQIQRLDEDKAFDISAAVADLGHDPRPFSAGIAAEAAASA